MSKKSFYKVNKLFDDPISQGKPTLTRSGVPVVQRPSASPSPDIAVRGDTNDPQIDDTTIHTAPGKKYTVKKVTSKVTTIEGGEDRTTATRQSRYLFDEQGQPQDADPQRSTIRSQYGSTGRRYQLAVGPDEFQNVLDDDYKKFYDPKTGLRNSRRNPRNDDDDKFNVFDDTDLALPEYQAFNRSYVGGADNYIVGNEELEIVSCGLIPRRSPKGNPFTSPSLTTSLFEKTIMVLKD